MYFIHKADIVKAENEKNNKIKVIIKASSEIEDREGEVILKSAFMNKNVIDNFLREGYYDYNHITDIIDEKIRYAKPSEIPELHKAKLEAIIGYPETLEVRDDGIYSTGYLIADNPYVQQIKKAWESGFTRFGASIAGYVSSIDKQTKTIKSIILKKIAIAPLQEVVNPDTQVIIAKSLTSIIENNLTDIKNFSNNTIMMEEANNNDLEKLKQRVDKLYELLLEEPEFQRVIACKISEYINRILYKNNYEISSKDIHPDVIKDFLINELCFNDKMINEFFSELINSAILNIKYENY